MEEREKLLTYRDRLEASLEAANEKLAVLAEREKRKEEEAGEVERIKEDFERLQEDFNKRLKALCCKHQREFCRRRIDHLYENSERTKELLLESIYLDKDIRRLPDRIRNQIEYLDKVLGN